MNHLKSLTLSFVLMCALAVVTLAGEPNSPCVPGQTDTPPCSSQALTGDSTDPGETNGPPASAPDLTTIVEAVQLALSLF